MLLLQNASPIDTLVATLNTLIKQYAPQISSAYPGASASFFDFGAAFLQVGTMHVILRKNFFDEKASELPAKGLIEAVSDMTRYAFYWLWCHKVWSEGKRLIHILDASFILFPTGRFCLCFWYSWLPMHKHMGWQILRKPAMWLLLTWLPPLLSLSQWDTLVALYAVILTPTFSGISKNSSLALLCIFTQTWAWFLEV